MNRNWSSAAISTLLILLLLVLLVTGITRLVQEFHERPIQVYYCDADGGCEVSA